MAGTWCDIAKVLELTGVTVDEPQLLRAQGVIETFVDVDPADPGEITARDRNRLTAATAYQAGWMFEQIALEQRTDVAQLSQDGTSFTYANPDAVVLAPLASRNIDRLSWNQDGAVAPRQGKRYETLADVEAAVLCDELELPETWVFESWSL